MSLPLPTVGQDRASRECSRSADGILTSTRPRACLHLRRIDSAEETCAENSTDKLLSLLSRLNYPISLLTATFFELMYWCLFSTLSHTSLETKMVDHPELFISCS